MYKVGLIGAGSIGALKPEDVDYPGSANILTHANAITAHKDTELTYIVDTDCDKLRRAAEKWEPQYTFESIERIGFLADIIIIATPTETHVSIIQEVMKANPKVIIAEKPFCTSWEEANFANTISSVPVMVNYIRRFTNGIIELKREIEAGMYGKCINARIVYTRSMARDGCHAVDLMRYFFGNCEHAEKLDTLDIYDFDKSTPTVSAFMKFNGCDNVIFQGFDGNCYGVFEIDMFFKKMRIRLIENSLYIERYPVIDNNEWGHKTMGCRLTEVVRKETFINIAMFGVISNAVNYINGKQELKCTAADALAVHGIIEELQWECRKKHTKVVQYLDCP